ncbi:regulator of gluconeogenesis Rmd5 [Drechmeria coniospora]|uniref:GID complex catalytic subunit 2 n=1 Tax=Drechmeria coniospora TaxID=98403 RepID=A0A151GVZ3_DRECN|nr:regulator of gluconeogenesis Rmd5 [Drechmeria coniospora]KYK61285.1 regulator of gluconeogenesis Rmd5 [Drechmeria coniospora]
MAGAEDSPFPPLLNELARVRRSNLTAAIGDVDKIIGLLMAARDQVAADDDAHKIGMAMTTLQNPVKAQLEAINNDLKEVTKAQKAFGKALDKQALPQRDLPMETDAMADHPALINRALAMHLLREGQFSVASTFLREEQQQREQKETATMSQLLQRRDEDGDNSMTKDDEGDAEMQSLHSEDLQDKFSEMYSILAELKQRNLTPAIRWARLNNGRLEGKGSNLEFELCKLQYIWLFKGHAQNGLPDDSSNGKLGALAYAQKHFAPFQRRHLKEIQQLICAMLFAPNIESSPYRHIFEINSAFEDVATSFTREFCSLLGLAAESPLYVAVTAGSIALPRLIKYTTYMKEKKTEWTTENELAFETPLPESMIYHPIFVCPVSKEQTTESNPAMMLPCGHVICRDSLHRIAKGSRYKCPYCPTEGHLRDATMITL